MGIKTRILASGASEDNAFNIGLLGFKMAVNEGLTVFNLIDGVVDEFNDESGTDEAEGTNDIYCGTDDFYTNNSVCISAGFTTTSITEPDTSTAGTNPAQGAGTYGTFTVPTGTTSFNASIWGSGGGGTSNSGGDGGAGGGGGFSTGIVSVTPGQSLTISVGEGGFSQPGTGDGGPGGNVKGGFGGYRPAPVQSPIAPVDTGGGGDTTSTTYSQGGGGGGLSGIFSGPLASGAPIAILIAGSGGGGAYTPGPTCNSGGAGGGLIGCRSPDHTENTNAGGGCNQYGGAGSQTVGGQGADANPPGPAPAGQSGGLYYGGNVNTYQPGNTTYTIGGAGGSGYYGGGSGNWRPGLHGAGGGGSSYIGSPLISSGSTEEGAIAEGGGTANPLYVAGTNEGGAKFTSGEDGYVLLSATSVASPGGGSTTIVSASFTSTTVPNSSRIVVFEENVDSPTLNTDIIASVSRDGTNFTNATLSDSGYVTGSSGQRILTGQADISGQPTGQSMRWKLQLANNTVKIHGVSLQWS